MNSTFSKQYLLKAFANSEPVCAWAQTQTNQVDFHLPEFSNLTKKWGTEFVDLYGGGSHGKPPGFQVVTSESLCFVSKNKSN